MKLVSRIALAFTLLVPLAPHAPATSGTPDVDLSLSALSIAPGAPLAGETTSFHATVRNVGNATSPSFEVRFTLDGNVTLGSHNVTGLAPGANATVVVTWNATAGNHTIRATADPENAVAETSESNNARTRSFSVASTGALPDLVVSGLSTTAAVELQPLYVTIGVRNAGVATAGASVAALYVDGSWTATATIAAISPGSTRYASFAPVHLPAGNHSVRVVADVWGAVTESSESNNARERFVIVERAGDLAVRIVSVEKPVIRTDFGEIGTNPVGPLNITVEFCNVGKGSLPNAYVQLNATAEADAIGESHEEIATIPWGFALAPGQCERRSREWRPFGVAGDVKILATGGTGAFDPNPANDRDEEDTFVILGGFGGVILADGDI